MDEVSEEKVCPKCGGAMVKGGLKVPFERATTQTVNPLTPGVSMGSLPPVVEEVSTEAHWEEKTGKKTGFIFKTDEIRRMRLEGYRCRLCNYVEIYTRGK
ncbi:MAG: hypothetical protein JSV18_07145 [Candidatus Bathyarchaeota archaeon]|nr:MAG: hypothetical protein JSV18_07145 [Candidatus Bathyarchaeota archaeon]